MLASIGLPGLSGFVSEFLDPDRHLRHARLVGRAVATLGVVAAAAYLLWAYQRVFQGTAAGANAEIADASTKERWVLVPVVALIVVLGVFPKPVLDRITPSVQQLIDHVAPSGVEQVIARHHPLDPLPGDPAGPDLLRRVARAAPRRARSCRAR